MQKHTFGRPSLHHVEVRIGKVDMSGSSKAVHVGLRNSLVGYYDHGALNRQDDELRFFSL